jgi:hypothetical protein
MMSTTGDPSVFQLSNFNIQDLLSNPEGEIEVSLGQIPFSFGQQSSNGPDMFCHYNFGSPVAGPSLQSTENTNVNLSQTLSSNETLPDFSTFFSNQPPNGSASIPEQRDSNSFSNDNIFQFLDLEAAGPADAPASSQAFSTYTNTSLDQDSIQSTHTMPPGPYVPPTGAAYSSTRRVAASWKPPFVTSPDSPVEHSPKYT